MGAWRLAEFSVIARDGSVTHPMGKDLEGLIIYSPDGYMSEELAAAAAGYLAHSGPFYVDEEVATLRHHMSVSLFPNWVGDTPERFVELDGDILTISTAPVIVEGIELTPRLIWRRATPNPG
jgi:hypothetical protein